MHIENQVCTLNQARTLMELGIDQNIVNFYWMAPNNKDAFELVYNTGGYEWTDHPGYKEWPHRKAAYTTAELGIMLPPGFDTLQHHHEGELIWEAYDHYSNPVPGTIKQTEAESRAAALLWAVNSTTYAYTVNDINKRLSGGL